MESKKRTIQMPILISKFKSLNTPLVLSPKKQKKERTKTKTHRLGIHCCYFPSRTLISRHSVLSPDSSNIRKKKEKLNANVRISLSLAKSITATSLLPVKGPLLAQVWFPSPSLPASLYFFPLSTRSTVYHSLQNPSSFSVNLVNFSA